MFSHRLIHVTFSYEEIKRAVQEYFCECRFSIDKNGNIQDEHSKTIIGGFRVRHFKNRWRFERVIV